ncbi:NAD(P)H-dependent oxidoreductase subunit E [Paraburkholderia sp. CNPSo 3272]|uniref:NAD(P)H-dependent oxidoreductase subunit E n=1 Tax=Paraburkholderia sp. CNPSo 3272 TaxID=2940931 RepID=UPI0020B692C2|nr:NAD(P)H-dependent oxidoreductase subunit E [Paraburkholderia sp. CNPSo 3272]MCP3723805.1 NAD(P)H-dependent oxidoreductase subunit E [Paraburkholderia sp. CNPSo 3272]
MDETTVSAPDDLVLRHAQPGRTLLAILHAIQDEVGFVPPATVVPLSKALNLSRAEVHGVITYYHHFRTAPPAPVTVQLCRAEACRSMGSEALAQHVEAHTGCRFGQHGHDGEHAHTHEGPVALESVYCLGQCALSPAMMINGTLHAKVTPQKFDKLYAAALATVRTEEAA